MLDLLQNYFESFLHPFKKQDQLRDWRLANIRPEQELGLVELVSISWSFVIIRTFYALFTIYIAVSAYDYIQGSGSHARGLWPYFSMTTWNKMALFWSIGQAVFFPFMIFAYVKLWKGIIKFCATIFGLEGDMERASTQISNYSLTAHPFLLIPIFGEFLSFSCGIFYLFIGLRHNLKMEPLQVFLVLCCPLIVFLILGAMLGVYFLFLFGILWS